jgi:hypothetical protein
VGGQLVSRRSPSNRVVARIESYMYATQFVGVPRSRAILCRPVPNPNHPIRSNQITAREGTARAPPCCR